MSPVAVSDSGDKFQRMHIEHIDARAYIGEIESIIGYRDGLYVVAECLCCILVNHALTEPIFR